MGEYEEKLRKQIKERYGSIPKMASEIGIPTNTIYHALERGMDNTTTRTRNLILDALSEENGEELSQLNLTTDEQQLVDLYRNADKRGKAHIMEAARFASALSEKDGADGERVEQVGAVDAALW